MELRDYQIKAINDLRKSFASGHRAPLLVAPTGSGKTAIAAQIIRNAREKGQQVLFLAPRRELVYQTVERVERHDLEYGIIMAGQEPQLMPDVQIASIPTLHVRAIQREKMMLPPAGLVLVDESHIGVGGRSQEIIDYYKSHKATVIGLTATPARTDGRGLGMIYDDLVHGPTVKELTDMGYLVPARYFSGSKPDLDGIKTQAGDYHQGQLGERVNKPKLIGDIVSNWARLAHDRQTFVFAVNVAHSRHLCDEFKAIGINAEHIDGNTELEERRGIYQRLQDGTTQVVCNCQVYTYGVDFPPVSCIVLATPTKSITKYLQMAGRGLRPSPGKEDCFMLDHSGAVHEIGFVDDPMPWSLDGKEKLQERKAAMPKEPKEIECTECQAVFKPRKTCPNCGHDMTSKMRKAIEAHEAELVEIDKKRRAKEPQRWTINEKANFYAELKGYAMKKEYKIGWAAWAYKEKLGVWPNSPVIKNMKPKEPGTETLAWIRYRNIKRAKAKEKQQAQVAAV